MEVGWKRRLDDQTWDPEPFTSWLHAPIRRGQQRLKSALMERATGARCPGPATPYNHYQTPMGESLPQQRGSFLDKAEVLQPSTISLGSLPRCWLDHSCSAGQARYAHGRPFWSLATAPERKTHSTMRRERQTHCPPPLPRTAGSIAGKVPISSGPSGSLALNR